MHGPRLRHDRPAVPTGEQVIVRRLIQLANGTVSLVVHLPIQAVRTFDMLSPDDKLRVLKAIKAKALGEVKEPSEVRFLPMIALGIVGIVALNIYRTARSQ